MPSLGSTIYFGIVLWGEKFREFFVNYSLSSLLAPGNIPALANRENQNRFLICTTPEDWEWLQSQSNFFLLQRYMEAEFLPLKILQEEEYRKLDDILNSCKIYNMNQGHIALVKRMYASGAVGSIVIPDSVYANYSVSNAYKAISSGKKVVLVHCPRFATTDLVEDLSKEKYFTQGQPITIHARDLARIGLKNLHVDIRMQQWAFPYLPEFILEMWWPLSDQSGIVFHALNWWHAFINYGAMGNHNVENLDDNTIDGTYLARNFTRNDAYLMTDSDEFLLVTFSEHLNRSLRKFPNYDFPLPVVRDSLKIHHIREMIKGIMHRLIDPFKVNFFRHPVYLHSKDLTPQDYRVEKKAQKIIQKIFKPASFWEQFIVSISWRPYEDKLKEVAFHFFKSVYRKKIFRLMINLIMAAVILLLSIFVIAIRKIFLLKNKSNGKEKIEFFYNEYIKEDV